MPEPTPPLTTTSAELEAAAAAVRTPAQAAALLRAITAASAGLTEETAAQAAPQTLHAPEANAAADTLLEVARQGAATPAPVAATTVDALVEQTLSGARPTPPPSRVARGRTLLRQALLKELGPLRALDTTAYLAINNLPHPRPVDRFFSRFSWAMTGGTGWFLLLLAGIFFNRRRGWRATVAVAPALWLATSTVEHPIKRLFRRKRPFISLVQAVVVGRKPGSFSFPSGHSAAAAAGAWLITQEYPRLRGWCKFIAGLVCFSRIYLGAHYPGDVITGAGMGVFFARLYRGMLRRRK